MQRHPYYIVLTLAFCFTSLQYIQSAEEMLVYVNGQDVPAFDCWLTEKPTVSFSKEGVTVKSPTMETTLKFADIARIEFRSNDSGVLTDIEESESPLPATNLRFRYLDGQTVVIDGVSEDVRVQLFALDGKAAPVDATQSGERLIVRLGHLSKGVYILQVDQQTYKIYKK